MNDSLGSTHNLLLQTNWWQYSLSLMVVLGAILLGAQVIKRLRYGRSEYSNQVKVCASLALGTKERIMVVQVGSDELVVGVTAHSISLLTTRSIVEKATEQHLCPS